MFFAIIICLICLRDAYIEAAVNVLHETNEILPTQDAQVAIKRSNAYVLLKKLDASSNKKLHDYLKHSLNNRTTRHDIIDDILYYELFNEKILTVIIEKYDKSSIKTILGKLYVRRSLWWKSSVCVDKLKHVVSQEFSGIDMKDSIQVADEDSNLAHWSKMVQCHALMGNLLVSPVCERALQDKRRILSIKELPDESHSFMPTRVCDHALIALLVLNGVDLAQLFTDKDGKKLSIRNFAAENDRLFDNMIADYRQIIKKYSK